MTTAQAETTAFIDLFAGCGGLSLGLKQAGWRGVFAVELVEEVILQAEGCGFALIRKEPE